MRIFVSYRRGDSPFVAGRLNDALADVFGPKNVFYDVESIVPGVDFRVAIRDRLSRADVVLVVIGAGWDTHRLHSPTDYVRIEVEQALLSGKRVVPVLIDPASMPEQAVLPATLAALAFLNAVRLRPDPDFKTDVDRLVEGLRDDPRDDDGTGPWWGSRRVVAGAAVAGFAALVAIFALLAVRGDGGASAGSSTTTLPEITATSNVVNTTEPVTAPPSSVVSTTEPVTSPTSAAVSTTAPATTTTVWSGDSLTTSLDLSRWTVATPGPTVSIEPGPGGSTISISSAAARNAQGWLRTTCAFASDFTVSVSYEILDWPKAGQNRLGLLALTDDTHMAALERNSSVSPDVYLIDIGSGLPKTPAGLRPSTTASSGKLQLSRRGGTYTAAYRDGDEATWHPIGNGVAGSADPVTIGISLWSAAQPGREPPRVQFHDFTIDDGNCTA